MQKNLKILHGIICKEILAGKKLHMKLACPLISCMDFCDPLHVHWTICMKYALKYILVN